jgi:hypothetical protein
MGDKHTKEVEMEDMRHAIGWDQQAREAYSYYF